MIPTDFFATVKTQPPSVKLYATDRARQWYTQGMTVEPEIESTNQTTTGAHRFQKGNTFAKGGARPGAGRKPNKLTNLKLEAKDNPDGAATLLHAIYNLGLNGSTEKIRLEASIYYIDRLRGRPTATAILGIAGSQKLRPEDYLGIVDEIKSIRESELKLLEEHSSPTWQAQDDVPVVTEGDDD